MAFRIIPLYTIFDRDTFRMVPANTTQFRYKVSHSFIEVREEAAAFTFWNVIFK